MTNLNKKFQNALNKFVEKYKNDPNVVGIIVSGSFIHSIPDKNSDIDTYIILNDSHTRERGNTFIDGVEIEYFINPIKQIREYFRTETGSKAPCTAHMFANSKIIYKKGNTVDALIKEAKNIISKPESEMSKLEVQFVRYFIDDIQKDLEDTYLKKDKFAFNMTANELIAKCIETFYRIKRKQKEKTKRLKEQLKKLDNNFEKLISEAVNEKDLLKKFKNINKLVRYTERLIGGKRPKEWVLKSPCTYRK